MTSRLVLPGIVLVSGVVAAALLVTGLMVRANSPSGPRVEPPSRTSVPAQQAVRAASLVQPEGPVAVRLPSGKIVSVRAVSTRADGLLDVPADIRAAGWWRGGSRLGDPFGSTLIAAHVDSRTQGLGPYVELLRLHPGQRIRLYSRHLAQDFVTRRLRLLAQGSLTRFPWIRSAHGQRRLTLVTCAPPFDPDHGGYRNLAVVTALPVTDAWKRGHR